MQKDVKVDVLAKRTPGFTPADIENIMNEAAILTARKREKQIHMDTIEEAITKSYGWGSQEVKSYKRKR